MALKLRQWHWKWREVRKWKSSWNVLPKKGLISNLIRRRNILAGFVFLHLKSFATKRFQKYNFVYSACADKSRHFNRSSVFTISERYDLAKIIADFQGGCYFKKLFKKNKYAEIQSTWCLHMSMLLCCTVFEIYVFMCISKVLLFQHFVYCLRFKLKQA